MCELIDNFEYYPELIGYIYNNKNMMIKLNKLNKLNKIKHITDDNKKKIYYNKIYQDIYDDEIINYVHIKYIDIVTTMIEYNVNDKYAIIINRIQKLLIFKEIYHKAKNRKIEHVLLQMINETNYNTLSLIYTSPNGTVSILYPTELERHQNCDTYISNHSIVRLIENTRYYIRGQYYCGLAIMEILHKELLHINGLLFKIELIIRNNIILPYIKKAFIIILDGYITKQSTILNKMDKISTDLKKLKYKRNPNFYNKTNNNTIIRVSSLFM